MPKVDFSQIENMMRSSLNFSLSEKQYEKLTGRKMPKDTSYLIRRSALSRFAEEKGLKITVQEKTISFEKKD